MALPRRLPSASSSSSSSPSSFWLLRLQDLSSVLSGVQKVANVAVRNHARQVSSPRLRSARPTSAPSPRPCPLEQMRRDWAKSDRLSAEAVHLKSQVILENVLEFAKAVSGTYSKEKLAKSLDELSDTELRDFLVERIKGSKKFRPNPSNPAEVIEYELNPEVSALDLLEVDLLDRESIERAIFRPKPKVENLGGQKPKVRTEKEEMASEEETGHEENLIIKEKTLSSTSSERAVPSSRLGRMASFGTLGVGLGLGAVAEASKRAIGLSNAAEGSSILLSESNAERIVRTLCRVRGAALKIGQMLSIQDEAVMNPQLAEIFERVRESADFMPVWQMEEVMSAEFGPDWRETHFSEFDHRPFAAASIGQVHAGRLASNGQRVAVKIQYPGVAKGIESDINNLLGVLKVANILPEGLFIDSVVEHMKVELAQECDYEREAECCRRMKLLLGDNPHLHVPSVVDELSTKQVFTTEMIEGLTIDQCADLDQTTRNNITLWILELLLRELFVHRYMQTDPNWANFLYNPRTKKLGLLDFGATREFRPFFVNNYYKIINGAAENDRDAVLKYSRKVGFLTGYESQIMNNAHCDSVLILGECFRSDSDFDFGRQKTTQRMQDLVPVMLKHRLCPPPPEVYSLHRKMSGLFLLASKLRARINCRPVWLRLREEYRPHSEEE